MFTGKLSFIFLSTAMLLMLSNCKKETHIAYPTLFPVDSMLTFLPGIVSSDSFEFNSMYSPNGKTFYFSREQIHNIYETTFDGTVWSTPSVTSFSEKDYKECDPAFSTDGTKLFYISTRPRAPNDSIDDFDIWYVEREGNDWSIPKNLDIVNSDSSEFYVSFARNGNLYFASNRVGGFGSFDIYVSRYETGVYTSPVNIGAAVNNDHFDHDPFISSDERLLIFTSVNRDGGFGRGDLYYSVKDEAGQWSVAKNLGPTFNGSEYDFCPYITPDGRYFFYSDNKDIRWIDAEVLYKVTEN